MRIKKCLICFKNTAAGSKQCEHCGFKFKSIKRDWHNRLKDIVVRFTYGRD